MHLKGYSEFNAGILAASTASALNGMHIQRHTYLHEKVRIVTLLFDIYELKVNLGQSTLQFKVPLFKVPLFKVPLFKVPFPVPFKVQLLLQRRPQGKMQRSSAQLNSALLIVTLFLFCSNVFADDFLESKKWKIVNYWSVWCGPCRVEIPELNLLGEELAPFGVLLVGVNFDEDPREKTMKIAKRMGIDFPTLKLATVNALQIEAPSVLPTTYILGPNNDVKLKLVGAQDRESLKKALANLNFAEGKI